MNMTQQELFKAFESLPTEAQRQALNFIAFLQQTYTPTITNPKKVEINWTDNPFIGMWKERQDMLDSTTWVRGIRNNEWSKSNDESNNH
jgi:hypothetical protein